jgi:hypothetical protein
MIELNNVNIGMPDNVHYLYACGGGGIGPVPGKSSENVGGACGAGPVPPPPSHIILNPNPGNGLATNATCIGPNETFQLIFQQPNPGILPGTFVLITAKGNFVSAIGLGQAKLGGGMGGFTGIDPANAWPLHTDSPNPNDPNNQFAIQVLDVTFAPTFVWVLGPIAVQWTIAIVCPDGKHFVTAVNGGGITDVVPGTTPIHTDGAGLYAPFDIFSFNKPVYFFVQFQFYTTDKDLSSGAAGRQGSTLSAVFTLGDGTTFVIPAINVDSATGENLIQFPDYQTNICLFPLPFPVTAEFITSITLTLNQGQIFLPTTTANEWHLGALTIVLLQNQPAPSDVVNPPANPFKVLVKVGDGQQGTLYVFDPDTPSHTWNVPYIT